MKRQLITLLLVIVMVAAGFTALEATTATPAAALTATKTTLKVSKYNAAVNEQLTFTVKLTRYSASTGTYVALPYKNVTIYRVTNGVTYAVATVKTNSTGGFIWKKAYSSPVTGNFYAKFKGDSAYGASQSSSVLAMWRYRTGLTLTYPQQVNTGQTYSLTVRLMNLQTGKPVVGAPVALQYNYTGGSKFTTWRTVTTDSNGYFTATNCRDTRDVWWRAYYNGDNSNYAVTTSNCYVKVVTGTKIWMSTTTTSPANHQKFRLYGVLTDQYGVPLKGVNDGFSYRPEQHVYIWGRLSPLTNPGSTWKQISPAVTVTLDSGYFVWTYSFDDWSSHGVFYEFKAVYTPPLSYEGSPHYLSSESNAVRVTTP